MDYMSRLYQNKAIQLQEQINFLERRLKQLAEATAWSPSSGGPAIPESDAGNTELKDRMRNIKQSGDRQQSKEYLEMEAELNRRTGAKPTTTTTTSAAPAQGSGTNRSDPDVQRGQRPIYPEGQSDSTYTKPASTPKPQAQSTRQTPDTLDLYNLRKKEDSGLQGELNKGFGLDWLGQSGKDNNIVTKTMEVPGGDAIGHNKNVEATKTIQDPTGMDPKGILLAAGAGLYGANKIREYINRQRVSPKPANLGSTVPTGQDPVKPSGQDPVKPSAQDGTRPTGQDPVKPSGQDPVKPKVQEGIPKSGSWTFDLPAQAEYMQNPPDWSMPNQHGRAEFPGLDSGGRTPDGKFVKDRNTKAGVERARGTPLEGGFGTATAGEPPVYPQGSYSTPEGRVVSPEAPKGAAKPTGAAAQGARMSGSQVTSKIPTAGARAGAGLGTRVAKGVGNLGVDLAAMYATGDMGEKAAEGLGAGESLADVSGSAASFAPMAMGVNTNAAVATGYVLGRFIDKGMEASGQADKQRLDMIRKSMADNAEAMKGVSSLEDAQKQGQTVADQAKRRRSTDLGKGFATPEEAAEFAKNMQDPAFRAAQERKLARAKQREIERIEGGYAIPEVVGDYTPDWVNAIGEYDPLGKATNFAIDTVPGGRWAAGKAGEALNWLSK